MPITTTEVTLITGEQSSWKIVKNLGDAYLFPIKHHATLMVHPDKELLESLISDPGLQAILRAMLLSEVSDHATVARKDGVFGVLYFRHFDCAESDLGSNKAAPSRGRVIRRIQADILSELSLNPRFPNGIDIAIPAPSALTHNQVALWIFVPHDVFSENGKWDVLEDVVSLLME